MKKIVLLLLLLLSVTSFAGELSSFAEIKSAVVSGKQIRIAADFSKCEQIKDKAAGGMPVSVFSPSEIQVFNTRMVSSLMRFTLNNPAFPKTPIYEYVGYSIDNGEDLTLSYQVLDARSYSPINGEHTYVCKLNVGFKVYA